MKLENIFYFKNIVDELYPTETIPSVDTSKVVSNVQRQVQKLSDTDFSEIIISCFIPDLYSGMGKREKLFTKLTELMVGEWWRRMGGTYHLPTKKSGTEDVELIYNNISVVCDAKVFRLGRSQKAPNVKDFLKLASVKLWIDNLNNVYKNNSINRTVIGGLVTYSSLHEWESDSEVYEECTNKKIPVIMLPYEVMAFLLKNKSKVSLKDFMKIWNYSDNDVTTSRIKSNYWNYITNFICDMLCIDINQYNQEMKEYHSQILNATSEYRKLIQETIGLVNAKIDMELNKYTTFETLRAYAFEQLKNRDNAIALDYLNHINEFRKYKD